MTETHSLQRRSLYKLGVNVAGAAIALVSQAIVPRGLGPADYGNFSYITSFFTQALGFLNLNSSTAFYAKLSQRPGDRGLVRFYFLLLAAMAALLALFVAAVRLLGLDDRFWPGLTHGTVALGALWAALSFLSMVLAEMSDAYGLTVHSERVKVLAKIAGVATLLLIFKAGWLTLGAYFAQQLALLALAAAALFYLVRRRAPPAAAPAQPPAYAAEFKAFCLPLFVFTLFSVLEQMLDRWFIQRFSGPENQGYYALASQVGTLCFLFTSAALPLLFRENAILFHAGDFPRLRRVFTRSFNLLYGLSAAVCAFFAAQSESFVRLFGGRAFEQALVPFLVMAFYPVHQTLGQLCGNLFFASERVKKYRDIGIAMLLLGLPMTFLLLGPRSHGAWELGATGLAAKMVLLQIVSVNVQLYYHARFLEVPFLPMVKTQVVVLLVFVALAAAAARAGKWFSPSMAVQVGLSAALYGGAVVAVARFRPSLLSLEDQDLGRLWEYGRKKLGGAGA